MKSEVIEKVVDTYPRLKRLNVAYGSLIIMFNAPKTGTVVSTHDLPHRLGEYSEGWCEENAKPFEGSVTLSNG
jgi:hypothetical protein